jgi:hypothetical protein
MGAAKTAASKRMGKPEAPPAGQRLPTFWLETAMQRLLTPRIIGVLFVVCSLWIGGAHGNPDDDCCVAEIRLKEELDSMHRSLSRSLDEIRSSFHRSNPCRSSSRGSEPRQVSRETNGASPEPHLFPLSGAAPSRVCPRIPPLSNLLRWLPSVPVFAVWQRQVPVVAHSLDSAEVSQFQTKVARTISKKASPGVM